jgi:hypothetical protein
MPPPHHIWTRDAVFIGLSTATFFTIILGCAGTFAIAYGVTPWIQAVALLAAAALGVIAARGSWALSQERFRSQNNLCLRCGYSLIALTSGVCPECGKPVSRMS